MLTGTPTTTLAILSGLALGAIIPAAFASDLVYTTGHAPAQVTGAPQLNAAFIRSQNAHEAREHHGLLTREEERTHLERRSSDARSAVRGAVAYRLGLVAARAQREFLLNASPMARSVATAVGVGFAIYSGEAFRFSLAEDLVLSVRSAFSTRGGYFSSLGSSRYGVFWNRSMTATEHLTGLYALLPFLEIQSQFSMNEASAVQGSLSKSISKGLDLSIAQATGSYRAPASSELRLAYGFSF